MPRYTEKVAKQRAEMLIKPLIRNGMNTAKTARELGVTQEAIHQRLQRKPVQDALQRFINSPKLKEKLIEVAKKGLSANKVISCNVISKNGEGMADANTMTKDFIDVPDHYVRHKFWHDLCSAGGILNNDDKAGGVRIINIIHNYRRENNINVNTTNP